MVRLRPGTRHLSGNRHGGRDAVENELHHGVAPLEDLVLKRKRLARLPKIVFGPALPGETIGVEPGIEDRMVDIEQRVEVDEAGTDDRVAVVIGDIDITREPMPNVDDGIILIDHLAIAIDRMVVPGIADHKSSCSLCPHPLPP